MTFADQNGTFNIVIGNIFVARPIFQESIDLLRSEAVLRENTEDRVLSQAELIAGLREADGAITLVTDSVNRIVLESAPRLKVVANFGVGVNNVDVAAATELGIAVTNTPGVLTETTADLAWALLMCAARRIVESDRYTRAGRFKAWGPKVFLGYDVFGKTLGLIGFGRIGQAVARRARGFGMSILVTRSTPFPADAALEAGVEPVPLDEIYRRSDFISLHAPLSPETHHLVNDRSFALMKASCILINASRGPLVDEKALVRALRAGKIAGAALDVFEREPEIEPELLEMDNVVLAPHIGSASHETRLKMSMIAANNLIVGLKGSRPPNLVNPEVWERRRV